MEPPGSASGAILREHPASCWNRRVRQAAQFQHGQRQWTAGSTRRV